jgi:hypothetical protein
MTTVPVIPDAPIGHFRLTLFGAKQGYLINTRNLCQQPPSIQISYAAQSGKTREETVKVKTGCPKRSSNGRRAHHRSQR